MIKNQKKSSVSLHDQMGFDVVDKPYHYNVCGEKDDKGRSVHEPIKIIEGWGYAEGFCMGNALKYILRAPHKGSEREDLEKAHWYLCRLVESGEKLTHRDTCISPQLIDVVKAWGLPEMLSRAVAFVALGSPQVAAEAVEEYLKEGS